MTHFIITHKAHFLPSLYGLRETTEGVFFSWLQVAFSVSIHSIIYIRDFKEEQFVLNFYQHLCHVRQAQKLFLCPIGRQIGLFYNFNLA